MTEHMLTTVDNPFNPFTHYDEWDAFDRTQGYHTSAFLARIVRTSDDLSEADQSLAIELAIEEIVKENVSGMHIRVEEDGTRSLLDSIDDSVTSVEDHSRTVTAEATKKFPNPNVTRTIK